MLNLIALYIQEHPIQKIRRCKLRYAPNSYQLIQVCDWLTALYPTVVKIAKCHLTRVKDFLLSRQVSFPNDSIATACLRRFVLAAERLLFALGTESAYIYAIFTVK